MEPFEYVVVITSLITGLGIAQILNGLADMVSGIKHIKVSAPHILMVLSVLLELYQEWFYNYQYATQVDDWTMQLIAGLLLFPIMLFVLARMLIPTGLRSQEKDLNAYYYDQWQGLFIVQIWVVLISIFQDVYISNYSILDQFPKLLIIGGFSTFLLLRVRNHVAHIVLQTLFFIGMIIFIVVTDAPLVDFQE